ncbi:MAG: hypothetical protein RL698_2309 [Pseudomonadota bacterium]|jgi:hypothetical protein
MFNAPIGGFGAIPTQSIPGPLPMPFAALILVAVTLFALGVLWRLHEAEHGGRPGNGSNVRRPVFRHLGHRPNQRAA